MRLSKKAEYGLRALATMARGKASWSIQELSEAEHIPVKFLEQILLALRHAGVLTSRRGVGGGKPIVKIDLDRVRHVLRDVRNSCNTGGAND